MACVVVLTGVSGNHGLGFLGALHGMGKGEKFAHFLGIFCFGRLGQGEVVHICVGVFVKALII